MRKPARATVIIAAGAALIACGTAGVAAAAPRTAAVTKTVTKTVRYYAFDINNGTTDPGLVPVPGTPPGKFAQGDELIINDQVTSTHLVKGGYPIVGFDSGTCVLTRIPEKNANQTIADCVVSVDVKGGSLTVQGALHFKSQQPAAATLAVTGGTGNFTGAVGQVGVSFTKNYEIFTFTLK
jgi:Dirigent-like protein